MTDRDTFAAAALTGLLANPRHDEDNVEEICRWAWNWADSMLRERGTAFQGDCVSGNNPEIVCPVTKPLPKEKPAEVSAEHYAEEFAKWQECMKKWIDSAPTAHDAAPAAKAEPSERGTRREGQGTGDICERLRGWFKDVNAVPATDLMDEAAAEIERLRLTDFEKEAIEQGASCISRLLPHWGHPMSLRAAALRELLERLK